MAFREAHLRALTLMDSCWERARRGSSAEVYLLRDWSLPLPRGAPSALPTEPPGASQSKPGAGGSSAVPRLPATSDPFPGARFAGLLWWMRRVMAQTSAIATCWSDHPSMPGGTFGSIGLGHVSSSASVNSIHFKFSFSVPVVSWFLSLSLSRRWLSFRRIAHLRH